MAKENEFSSPKTAMDKKETINKTTNSEDKDDLKVEIVTNVRAPQSQETLGMNYYQGEVKASPGTVETAEEGFPGLLSKALFGNAEVNHDSKMEFGSLNPRRLDEEEMKALMASMKGKGIASHFTRPSRFN